jgi:hypothetical protein
MKAETISEAVTMSQSRALVLKRRMAIRVKFGVQDYPDGTYPSMRAVSRATAARSEVEHARTAGTLTWALLMREEICEIRCESDPVRLQEELVDTIALLEEWLDAVRRRTRA